MTTLTIRNIRGIEAADLDLTGPITAVLGPNGSGKTSVALALAACLTGSTTPISGKARGADRDMARDGAAKGVAVLSSGESRAMIEWPSGKSQTLGDPPHATPAAAGLISVVTMSPKERAEAFVELFQTEPSREDLDAELVSLGSAAAGDKLWDHITKMGWASTEETAKETATRLKGAWREATGGATWGSDVGATWVPEGWTVALDGASQAELEAGVDQARQAARQAVAGAAVAGERRAELERVAGLATTAAQQIDKLQAELTKLEAVLQEAQQVRAALPASPEAKSHALTCPECNARLTIRAGVLITIVPISDAELREVQMAIASADGKVEHAKGEVYGAQARLNSAKGDADAAARAKAEIVTFSRHDRDGEKLHLANDDPDAAVRRAEADLTMWRARTRAAELHEQIIRQVAIAAACGPAGARKRKLDAVLGEINKSLAGLAQAMGCPSVAFDGNLGVAMGGRAYPALSASEQWRTRALVQLEIARRDGSAMAVLDGADILDHAGRAGLCGALQRAGLVALVALTANQPGPDLFRQAGLGRSYWIEAGQAAPMDDAAQGRKAA